MKDSVLYYSVGPLLYCPANHTGIADSLIQERFGVHYSLALCLEDTISDHHVEAAEQQLVATVKALQAASEKKHFFRPGIFVRVRNPQQIGKLLRLLENDTRLMSGFILPKFSFKNADSYMEAILAANQNSKKTLYMMPILEDPALTDLRTRHELLYGLKEKLDSMEELVLNVRVGGNDLCHIYGFRRSPKESIHSIRAISDIFSDIIAVFGKNYVVSGPVWEYYRGKHWKKGFKQELKEDRLCGFTGKTVIHPKQIQLVNEAYQVSEKDLADARSILEWDKASPSLVSGSASRERMNEYKVHSNWAKRILLLSTAYGIR
ncbi:MAG: HpcH/HpaI aldolase/citrate lyase family protein [Lachnospiraceae bacterium]|nr:HpcH/HpaI aldolase/citrate lyase family protein [Lachnospiraceae bacterium]